MTECPKCHQRNGLRPISTFSRDSAMHHNESSSIEFVDGDSCWNCGHWINADIKPMFYDPKPDKKFYRRVSTRKPLERNCPTETDRLVWQYKALVEDMLASLPLAEVVIQLKIKFVRYRMNKNAVHASVMRLQEGILQKYLTDGLMQGNKSIVRSRGVITERFGEMMAEKSATLEALAEAAGVGVGTVKNMRNGFPVLQKHVDKVLVALLNNDFTRQRKGAKWNSSSEQHVS